jgi:hypothetical protein
MRRVLQEMEQDEIWASMSSLLPVKYITFRNKLTVHWIVTTYGLNAPTGLNMEPWIRVRTAKQGNATYSDGDVLVGDDEVWRHVLQSAATEQRMVTPPFWKKRSNACYWNHNWNEGEFRTFWNTVAY